MKKLIVLIPALLSGCAIATTLPPYKGKQVYLIECDGTGQTIGSCYRKAAELCNNDYILTSKERLNSGTVMASQSTSSGFATPQMANVTSQGSMFGTPIIERNITVVCGLTEKTK